MAEPKWQNRIIETRYVSAKELKANRLNWRVHPQAQIKAIRALLSEVGIVAPLIAYESKRHGGLTLIDGHMRQEAGGEWPVTILDVTDEEADLILATIDPIGALAETDSEILDALLREVNTGEQALQELLGQMDAENELTSLQAVGDGESNERNLSSKGNIKAVISLEQVATFEQAIRATGLRNRGEAVLAICEFYLKHGEERQLNDFFEEIAQT